MYVATINTPGCLPGVSEDGFELITDAWAWLADERQAACEECTHGACDVPVTAMLSQDRCGSLHVHTPGHESAHDLGLIYSVDPML